MRKVSLVFIAALSICGTGALSMQNNIHRDEWMMVYSSGVRVGYTHQTVTRAKPGRRPVWRIRETTYMRIPMAMDGGRALPTVHAERLACLDEHLIPIHESFTTCASGSGRQHCDVWYGRGVIRRKLTEGGKTTTRFVRIPPGTDFARQYAYDLGVEHPVVGVCDQDASFDWNTLRIETNESQVLRRERTRVGGADYDAFVVRLGDDTSECRLGDGRLLKVADESGSYVAVRSDRQAASRIPEQRIVRVANGLKPDYRIDNPSKLDELVLRLADLGFGMPAIQDRQQSAVCSKTDNSVTYTIRNVRVQPSADPSLGARQPGYEEWLSLTGECRASPQVAALARRVTRGETTMYGAATRICAWVGTNIRYDSRHVPFDAASILRVRRGDCKHHAILYAALARSVGIPTRFVGGYVLVAPDTLGPHAWAESYVGEWVSFDPTAHGPDPYPHLTVYEGHFRPGHSLETGDPSGRSLSPQVIACRYRRIQGSSPRPLRKGCYRMTCTHGISFDIPNKRKYSGDICKVHSEHSTDWTEVVNPDGKTYYYPTRVHLETWY